MHGTKHISSAPARQWCLLALGELGGSSLGICCNAEAAVLVVRHATYLWAGRRGPPRSSLESFSAWVESLDKILKDLQALDRNPELQRYRVHSKKWLRMPGRRVHTFSCVGTAVYTFSCVGTPVFAFAAKGMFGTLIAAKKYSGSASLSSHCADEYAQ